MERPGERDERLGRTPVLPLRALDPEVERTRCFCRTGEVRDADGAGRRLASRRIEAGRLSRGDGVDGCLTVFCRLVRARETSSVRRRGFGADEATRSAVRPGRSWRLDASEEGLDFCFPPDLGFDREPPLAFGRERDGFEGLARFDPDFPVGFVGLAREGVDLPRGAVALGRSRVCRGLAIFL
jgi:hypothetical protein